MPEPWSEADASDLRGLCAHFGVATHFDDIWGKRREVAPEDLVALLSEFEVRLDGSLTPGAALDAVRRAAWARSLPPVAAIQASANEWSLRVRLPAAAHEVRWRLKEEGGVRHEGVMNVHVRPELARTEIDSVPWCERDLVFGVTLPVGYHHLNLEGLAGETLIVSAPDRCYRPEALQGGGRIFGPAVQLYSLRSTRNWGIGDFTDLAQLMPLVASQGASLIGLNPLHALFPHNPAHASPYSPSSRQHLNSLYIDVEAVDEYAECDAAQRLVRSPEFQARLAALRETTLIDHPGVAAAKFEVLEILFASFRARRLSEDGRSARDAAGREFLAFVAQGGESLSGHALFEALQARFHAEDPAVWGPPVWPPAYRDLAGEAVRRFALENYKRVQFHKYLQWVAELQLERASARGQALGLSVGLYLDLAVSVDRAGSDAWREGDIFSASASVGAPPDAFNPSGQGWGLPPLRPDRLRESRYRFFIETLRANMRHAGALRIDHVMGLMRLFWIPEGKTPAEGAYVHYALDEMLAIVAVESQRARCLIIGEDLGTVADEVRTALSRFDVLSYRLLYFERQPGGDFKAPSDYPECALVAISTHDLPPLSGWWSSEDIRQRLQLGLIPGPEAFEQLLLERAQDRVRLILAAQREGLLSAEEATVILGENALSGRAVDALHAFLAKTTSAVMIVHLEDALGVVDQINMPGTTEEHPNWRRKMPVDLNAISKHEGVLNLTRLLSLERPRKAEAPGAGARPLATIPRATYRIQFHKDFDFDDARKVLPYLKRLGVSHVYCSPIQRARPGSLHGYDVMAHDEINPELGGREGFDRFTRALRENSMGNILDLVPNHMGVQGGENPWWTDTLENGPASLYAQHFDIDWQPLNPELAFKVLLPILGDHYGSVLKRGEMALRFEEGTGSMALAYFEHRFPLAPETYPEVLRRAEASIEDAELSASLASIATAFTNLPGRTVEAAVARAERARDKERLKARLARLCSREPRVAQAIAGAVAQMNLPSACLDLHALIERQAYRPAFWRVAADEINYRRFFDVNELAALRIERDEVFEATHGFALDLAAEGALDGLRIDHPDGLYDPARYFAKLQEGYARRAGLILQERDGQGRLSRPLYVVAEKIPAPHEEVPENWRIHGTTGYRFANLANGLLVDGSAASKLELTFRAFTGIRDDFDQIAYASKRDIIRNVLSSELNVLATELVRIARASLETRDYTLNALRRALADVAACMPVYRTYIVENASDQDVRYVDWAVGKAERQSWAADLSVFGFVRRTMLGQAEPDAPDDLRERIRRFAMRFQQYSAPVAAKGLEDTAFYRYFPLSSLNEVGGEPDVFGATAAEFHEAALYRRQRWPQAMLTTSTHDSKRSEDVRNRINVLSEIPALWRLALRRLRSLSLGVRRMMEAEGLPEQAPSNADEYLLYQTLLGTLPAEGLDEATLPPYRERMVRYMLKAAREAKTRTRWIHPDEAYEGALERFVGEILRSVDHNLFLERLRPTLETVARFGAFNSLTTTVLKFTSPGVPDIYQGHETSCLSLVDPDNRGPVDYEALGRSLSSLDGLGPEEVGALLNAPHDGRAKLWVTRRLLALRAEHEGLFRDGSYQPLEVQGAKAPHAIAFARVHERETLIVIAGRLFATLLGEEAKAPIGDAVWADAAVQVDLPEGSRLENVLSGEYVEIRSGRIALGDAFRRLPVAAMRFAGE